MEMRQIRFDVQRKSGLRADIIGSVCLKKRIMGAEGKYDEYLSLESPISQHGDYIRIQGIADRRIRIVDIK